MAFYPQIVIQSGKLVKRTISPFIWTTRYLLLKLIRRYMAEIRGAEFLPRQGPFIVAANHINSLDAFFIAAAIMPETKRMIHFISKIAPWGWVWKNVISLHWAEVIPFDPDNKEKCLTHAMDFLRAGEIVGIFPEGKPNKEPLLVKAKTGAARLALWARAPVVPVGFHNMPGWTRREIIANALKRLATIRVHIGKPLTFSEYYNREITKELLDDISRLIMVEIGKLCEKSYPY